MKEKAFPILTIFLIVIMILISMFWFAGETHASVHAADLPEPALSWRRVSSLEGLRPNNAPTITNIQPDSAPNDLDTLVVISGTDFTAGMSGTQVITPPLVYINSTELQDVIFGGTTTLSATLPWGLEPGIYTLTVQNPNGETGSLSNAFTVTQGIGVWNAGELYGGPVGTIVINPVTPTTLYADTGAIGLFRSKDSGENWSFVLAESAHNPAIDPVSPNRLYLSGTPHQPGQFLWRSDDEAETWVPLTTTFPVTQTTGRNCSVRHRIYPISGSVYVAACGADGESSGLITSDDYGEIWNPAMDGLTDTQVTAVAFHPTDIMTMYLGTASGKIFISHNGGVSWTFASKAVEYVHDLTVNPFGAHEVWVSADAWEGDPCAVVKSTNAELTAWQQVRDSCADVHFAPQAWGLAYSGTIFIETGYMSTDGGDSWAAFGSGWTTDRGWIRDITFHPTDPNIIYVAVHGVPEGLYKSTDGGGSWRVANHGLTAIVPEQMIVVPDQPDIVYSLSLWNIYRGVRGGQIWEHLPISRVVTFLLDPITPTRLYAGVDEGIRISDDGGYSWATFAQMVRPDEYPPDCGLWPRALSPAPEQPGVLLAGVEHGGFTSSCINARGSIYRSTNYGEDWVRIDLGREIGRVNDIAYDPANPGLIYASTDNVNGAGSGMLKSTDSGASWGFVGEGQLDGSLTDIEIEPGTHRVFVLVDALLPLYVSEDGGETWSATGNGDGHNVYDILFTPGNPPVIWDAAGQGLYRSTDGAQYWEQTPGIFGQVSVFALAAAQVDDRVVMYAGTTGGFVEKSLIQTRNLSGEKEIVNAGVYRYTMLNYRLYLPFFNK